MNFLDIFFANEPLALLDSEGAPRVPGVYPYSVTAGVLLPHIQVTVNISAIPNNDILAAGHAAENIPIAQVKDTIDTTMDNLIIDWEASPFQISKGNVPSN